MSINQGRRPGQIIATSEELQQILLCTVAEVKAVTVVIVASNHYSIPRFGGGSGGVGRWWASVINYIRSPDLID